MRSLAEAERQLRQEIARLQSRRLAENTLSGYSYDVRLFREWCERFHRSPLPATKDTVELFIADQLKSGMKVSTVHRRKCAIAHNHREHGLPSPVTPEVGHLLYAARCLRGEKPRRMRALTVKQLRGISRELARIGTDAAMRNRALLVLGFATALRRSSLAALTTSDVEFSGRGVIVSVQREKNDQEGKGRLIGAARGRNPNTCPVKTLRAWLARRAKLFGKAAGPLFPCLSRNWGLPMDGDTITQMVKSVVTLIGLEPDDYGAHSLRASFCTAAAEQGATELQIAATTGHKSMRVLREYIRRTSVWKGNASARLGL